MREVGFQQVMVVPVLATLGLGLLLYAQDISFTGPVGMAAPMVKPILPARSIRMAAGDPLSFELPMPGGMNAIEDNSAIRATTRNDLLLRAKENSGREDPFIPLLQPDPSIIEPPPVVSLPGLDPLMLPEIEKGKHPVKMRKRTVKIKVRNPRTGRVTEITREIMEPISLPKPQRTPPPPPVVLEPGWSVAGILSTGYDTLAILELDGTSREARVGDILDDNSRVLSITSQNVTLYKNGKKYVKTIGEIK
ncbi:MAG: hypothetical protein ACM3YO_07995 [Bacteroidota bacterium]